MGERRSIGALITVLRGSAVPYGYTLTVLSTHAVLTDAHGDPRVPEVLLFVLGAIAAFSLLGALAERLSPQPPRTDSSEVIWAGAVHAVAIGVAIGSAALLAMVPGAIAWALGSFAATALYLSIASAEIVAARRVEEDLGSR